jgi:hypothetical protein
MNQNYSAFGQGMTGKKSVDAKGLALDVFIPLTAFVGSAFFFSAERSFLIAVSIATVSLIVETNWNIAFKRWFIAIVSCVLAVNFSAIFLIKLPEELNIALALGPIFIVEFLILYWIVDAFKRRNASGA